MENSSIPRGLGGPCEDVGRLPVVRRDDPKHLLGYLGRASVMTARLRRHEEESRREPGWLHALTQ